MISRTADRLIGQAGIIYEEFIEDGLGRGKSAGFLSPCGKPFSIVEYLDAPSTPLTYIMSLDNSSSLTEDLKEILEELGLSISELAWVHPAIKVEVIREKEYRRERLRRPRK